jgi:1-acyl-sn-glycerol-3-phosphate acyltransferase
MRAIYQLIEQGTARLQAGRWVVIFPEGTRIPAGKKGTYHKGGALLAEKSGFPVVPVAHNAGYFWPRRKFMKRPGTIKVVIGPVIETKGRKASEINRLAEEWIEGQMPRLVPPGHGNG